MEKLVDAVVAEVVERAWRNGYTACAHDVDALTSDELAAITGACRSGALASALREAARLRLR